MRIERFAYHNKALEWELCPVDFSDLTLLVGVSGVGKTQILRALLVVQSIAEGKARNGVCWDITFTTEEGVRFGWKGEYENKEHFAEPEFEILEEERSATREKPKILTESLTREGDSIVERKQDEILLRGKPTPKLTPHRSVLNLLSQEDDVAPACRAFRRILDSRQEVRYYSPMELSSFERLLARYDTLEKIQESDLHTHLKLALVYRSQRPVFEKIRERFIEIFPHVTDIKVEPRKDEDAPYFVSQFPIISIQERGVSRWIDQWRISSGMLRTILHISEMYLWPTGTVILIDEFEDSLGVNCIGVLTEDLLQQNRNLQFIITSHHPYIINNIGPKYWKLVRRERGRVFTLDASSLGLSGSSHEAFLQLINNDKYREGIETK